MSMISVEEINNIRSNVDIVDVISSYIPLTPKGKNYFGKCGNISCRGRQGSWKEWGSSF